ncbi:MAG: 30S ribosome-binding factor RbfA [Candidatus Solibacter sp.]
MDARRILKVSEAVKEELSEIVGFEMEDPRLAEVDVTDVLVSPDSRHASVRVAVRGDERQVKKVLEALEHASGFLRRELASRLQLRYVPELHFAHDKNPDVDTRLDILLRRARKTRAREDPSRG